MDVRLYHFPPSLCSQKVRLALEEKGVAWESRLVDIGPAMENYEEWYARINPRMVVPTVDHDGRIVTDSARIVRYIDETFDGPALQPDAPEQREQMDEWIDRQDNFPFRELSYAVAPRLANWFVKRSFDGRRAKLRAGLNEHPELAELYHARLDDIDEWQATVENPSEVSTLHQRIDDLVDEFNQHIRTREYVVGGSYTLADVVWTVILARLRQMKLTHAWNSATWNYYEDVRARPSFESADIWESKRPLELLPRLLKSVGRRILS